MCAGFLKIGDVAAVDEVKTAVGEYDFCADVFEAVAYLNGLIAGDNFVIGHGVFEQVGEGVREQGDHEFVVAGKGVACAALHGGALYHVDARAIVLNHVEVGCDEVIDGVAQVAGNGEGFEKEFGEDDGGANVEVRAAFKGGDDRAEDAKVFKGCAANGFAAGTGLLVYDVCANGDVYSGWYV